jgi:hypothetical protein
LQSRLCGSHLRLARLMQSLLALVLVLAMVVLLLLVLLLPLVSVSVQVSVQVQVMVWLMQKACHLPRAQTVATARHTTAATMRS